jgi:hypothetical protein
MATPRATRRRCTLLFACSARFKAAKGRAGRRAIARGRGARVGARRDPSAPSMRRRAEERPRKAWRCARKSAIGAPPERTSRRPQTALRKYLLSHSLARLPQDPSASWRTICTGRQSEENGGECGVQTKSETASTTHVRRSSASAAVLLRRLGKRGGARSRPCPHQSGASSRSRVMPPGSDIDCLVFGAFASAPSSRDARAAVRRLSRFTSGASEVPFLSSAHRASAFCPLGAFPRPSLAPL